MSKEVIALIQFVLEQAEAQPVAVRVKLYRGLAKICGDQPEALALTGLADSLEKSDAACRQYVFSFSEKTKE